jgi:hypothetical protein
VQVVASSNLAAPTNSTTSSFHRRSAGLLCVSFQSRFSERHRSETRVDIGFAGDACFFFIELRKRTCYVCRWSKKLASHDRWNQNVFNELRGFLKPQILRENSTAGDLRDWGCFYRNFDAHPSVAIW